MNAVATTAEPTSRCRGERGTTMAAAIVLLCSFTAVAIIWLGRDVNENVALRSTAQSIAFQAARSGAQVVAFDELRGESAMVRLDAPLAEEVARQRSDELMAAYGVTGSAVAQADAATGNVTVTVTLDGPGDLTVTGIGSAHPETR